MSRNVPIQVRSVLYMKCGRRCAMPDCKIDLLPKITEDIESNISENAHIMGFSDDGPRAEKDLTDTEKNSVKNLIVICANCHVKIDKNPKIYTVEKLMKIKQDHEKKVFEKIITNVTNVGFSELDDAVKFLSSDGVSIQDEYTLITPKEKIKKNNLSNETTRLITHGMIGASQFSQYLEKHPNPQQGNRIRERFVQEYRRLRNKEKMKEDDLFNSLLDFASLHSNNTKKSSAGLAIVVYLFEKCEVFEK